MILRPIVIYAVVGFLLLNVKTIALPIGWFEVFFHELSHGIAALVTGGKIIALELNLNGSGSLTHAGSGIGMLVSFAGYAGASLWGLAIYKVFSPADKTTQNWTLALILVIGVSTLLWVKDWESLAVSILLVTILGLMRWFANQRLSSHIMGLIGASLMVSSSQSAWSLLSLSGKGDADALAKASLIIPPIVWVLLWITCGLACLLWTFRHENRQKLRFRF